MHFVLLAFLILVVIGFFVVLWFAAKNWRWYNIVGALMTMVLAVTFLFPTALALKSRSAWHNLHERLTRRVAEMEEEQHKLKYGDESDPSYGVGVVALTQQMDSIGIETGRRWRGMQLQGAANGSITLNAPVSAAGVPPIGDPSAPAADAAAAPAADLPLIPADMIIYGFAENQNGLPWKYIGEFRVTASTPTQVTIQPTGSISGAAPQGWSLYELLPADSHAPFVAEGSKPSEENLLGRVNEAFLKQALANVADPAAVQSYLEDGRRLRDEDPAISRWVTIQFLKKHSEEVDSPDSRGALDGGFFDSSGRAVDSRLQTGDRVSFDVGDEITVLEEKGQELVKQGIAEIKLDYYLRPLNDYRFALPYIRLRIQELATRKKELEREIVTSQAALDATIKNSATVQDEKLKLEQDLAQTQVERKALASYRDELAEAVKQTQNRVLALYRQNAQMEVELKQIHFALQAKIDAITMTE